MDLMTDRRSQPIPRAPFDRAHRRTGSGGAALLLTLLIVSTVGCTSPRSLLERAEEGGRHDRMSAFSDLGILAREGRLAELDEDLRGRFDAYLSRRFANEQNPTVRAEMLAVALEADLPCAPALLADGLDDPGVNVRLEAVDRIAAMPPLERRERLRRRLERDTDPLVQIAAARAYRRHGTEEWAPELVTVLMDSNHDSNVRFQAYLSAVALTGADLMFLPEDWRTWLETQRSAEAPR